MDIKKVQELYDVDIDHIALVDKAANDKQFFLFKRDDSAQEINSDEIPKNETVKTESAETEDIEKRGAKVSQSTKTIIANAIKTLQALIEESAEADVSKEEKSKEPEEKKSETVIVKTEEKKETEIEDELELDEQEIKDIVSKVVKEQFK